MSSVTFEKNNVPISEMTVNVADFTNGMWETDEMATMNVNRITVNATYADLTPDGSNVPVDYRLQAVVLGQEDNGSWLPLVRQFTPVYRSENAMTRRMIATSGPTAYDPGYGHIIPDALGNESVEVTAADVDVPEKIKVCITLADRNAGNADLTSFKITLTGQIV